MGKYIKIDIAYNFLTEYYNHRTDIQHQNLRKALNAIPSADVQPVVHGEWEVFDEPDTNAYECTACHDVFWLSDGTPFENNYNFCPNCGARMDGISDEN